MDTNITSALAEAAVLLGVGMVVVFMFLSLLIGSIHVISWLCSKFPEPPPVNETLGSAPVKPVSQDVLAVISDAVKQYRAAN
jgi:oxaloacetate decarboxylase gamma subunit